MNTAPGLFLIYITTFKNNDHCYRLGRIQEKQTYRYILTSNKLNVFNLNTFR